MQEEKRRQVNKKFFELKKVEYGDGIKRRQDRDDYVHVMQLDDGNSQASLACVH